MDIRCKIKETVLQSTDSERLVNRNGSCVNTQISLWRENRWDFGSGLRTGGDRNTRDHVGGHGGWPVGGGYLGSVESLAQGTLPGAYREDQLKLLAIVEVPWTGHPETHRQTLGGVQEFCGRGGRRNIGDRGLKDIIGRINQPGLYGLAETELTKLTIKPACDWPRSSVYMFELCSLI